MLYHFKTFELTFYSFRYWKTYCNSEWTSVSPCKFFLLNQHVICNMFRDHRISCLIHALQVLYALSILVGSPFMFPNPCQILHVISNPCRICSYVCNPS